MAGCPKTKLSCSILQQLKRKKNDPTVDFKVNRSSLGLGLGIGFY